MVMFLYAAATSTMEMTVPQTAAFVAVKVYWLYAVARALRCHCGSSRAVLGGHVGALGGISAGRCIRTMRLAEIGSQAPKRLTEDAFQATEQGRVDLLKTLKQRRTFGTNM